MLWRGTFGKKGTRPWIWEQFLFPLKHLEPVWVQAVIKANGGNSKLRQHLNKPLTASNRVCLINDETSFGSKILDLTVCVNTHSLEHTHTHTHTQRKETGSFFFLAMSSRPSSWFLIARVVLVIVTPGGRPPVLHTAEASGLPDRLQLAVVVLLVLLLHVVVVQVVVEQVRAAVLGGDPRLDAVLRQGGGHLDPVALRLRCCRQHLLPAVQRRRLQWFRQRKDDCNAAGGGGGGGVTWWSLRTPCLCLCCPSICGTWRTRPRWQARRCWAHWAEKSRWGESSWGRHKQRHVSWTCVHKINGHDWHEIVHASHDLLQRVKRGERPSPALKLISWSGVTVWLCEFTTQDFHISPESVSSGYTEQLSMPTGVSIATHPHPGFIYLTYVHPYYGTELCGSKKRELGGSANLTFWVGFHLSEGSSPLWGSSTGGCRMEMHTSPFWKGQ